jgi:ABC-type transport system involved in multi-copper enzyme maturation permease subunit
MRQHLREQRLAILVWAAMAALMSVIVAGTAPAMADPRLMKQFIAQLPEPALNLIGRPDSYTSLLDYYIAFKWLGIMPLLGSVFAATSAMGIIARDIDRRSADFPLSLPVSRACLLSARFAAQAMGLSVLYFGAFIALSLRLVSQGSDGSFVRYALYFGGCYCVSLAFAAGALLLSLTLRAYGSAARYAVLLTVGAYLLEVLNRLLQGPKVVGWFVLYGFTRTEDAIGLGAFPVGAVSAGLGLAALLLWLSARVFAQKQIPA